MRFLFLPYDEYSEWVLLILLVRRPICRQTHVDKRGRRGKFSRATPSLKNIFAIIRPTFDNRIDHLN